ncbi:hypothetical protein RI138_00140 [Streptomyces sp. C11-1]|uniref:Integrase n=1 Tax=Streptomyces durocortorensis TaxID=2811104 RepID=A0ABY9VQC9_9ACTN|nr:hypothetical protein [Streptomyces durocortorensis]WNF25334.1 hypothetical protein RI138_00140 [Streptomyces durocortorensis]
MPKRTSTPPAADRRAAGPTRHTHADTWIAPGSRYKLGSGTFSGGVPAALPGPRHRLAELARQRQRPIDPYTCDRAQIAVWVSDRSQSHALPLATRAAMVSAVTSFYDHLLNNLQVADGVEKNLSRARL